MKILLTSLLAIFLLDQPINGNIPFTVSLIGSGVSAGSTDSNAVTTTDYNTTGATLCVAGVATYNSATSIGDNQSNSWSALTEQAFSFYNSIRFYYVVNPITSTTHNFTGGSNTTYPSIAVLCFTGTHASAPFDQQNGILANTDGSGQLATGSVTPSVDNEIIISIASPTGTSVSSVDSGMTLLINISADANHVALGYAYKIQTSATAINPVWTTGLAVAGSSLSISTYKEAAGGGPTINPVTINPMTRGGGYFVR